MSSQSPSEDSPLLNQNNNKSDDDRSSGVNCSAGWNLMQQVFPCLLWIPKYNLKWLQCDVIAGLTVGLTVIPQGLAYAQIAGLPIQYGLYSAFMGGFVYSIFGTSKDVTLGPTAIMSLLVHTYGEHDVVQAVFLTLLGGCVQLAMGIFRLGFIMRYISAPVVSGFTSAGALTIAMGQLKHVFGVKTTSSSFFPQLIETFREVGAGRSNGWDILVGVCCIVILILMKFMNGPHSDANSGTDVSRCQLFCRKLIWLVSLGRNAIVVIAAASIAYAIHTQKVSSCKVPNCLTLTGNITKGLPPFKPPLVSEHVGNVTISTGQLVSRIGAGLVVVPMMGILESLAIAKAFARKNGYTLNVNQEMIAIGMANVISSFVSSYSITGSFSRTAINSQSGVQTPAGGIITGFIVILGLAFLTPLVYFIPKSALAAVIISAVVFMVDLGTVKQLWQTSKVDLVPLAVTFLVCFWQIPYGILFGIAASLVILLYPVTFPRVTSDRMVPVTGDTSSGAAYTVFRLQHCLSYPAVEHVLNCVKKQLTADCRNVMLDMRRVTEWDYTGLLMLNELVQDLRVRGTRLILVSMDGKLRASFVKSLESDGHRHVFFYKDVAEAVENELA